MTLRNTFPSGLPTGLPILDTRLALSGLIARDITGQPRLGLLPDSLDPVVTGTSSMAYQVGPFRAVTSRGGLGVELVANDGAVKVDTTAAPSTNARLDVIYVQPRFSLDGDATDFPTIGVVQGATAPVASLVRPPMPAGALILAVAQVSFGATSTAGSGVVITQLAPYTAANGGTVVVRDVSDLNGWAPHNNSRAYTLADGIEYVRHNGVWKGYSSVVRHFTANYRMVAGWNVFSTSSWWQTQGSTNVGWTTGMVAPVEGLYEVEAGFHLNSIHTVIVGLKLNDTVAQATGFIAGSTITGNSGWTSGIVSRQIRLKTGDVITPAAYVQTVPSVNVATGPQTYCSLRFVGV